MRLIGFAHGVAHKILDVYSTENIGLFKICGCNALEINCHSVEETEKLNKLLPLITNFKYISLHLPSNIKYKNDDTIHALLKKFRNFYVRSGAKLIVVHPDVVEDWSVFDNYPISWAIENMDDRKDSFKNADDLRIFFTNHKKWNLVLDLGHCNANDKSMVLANDLINNFKHKIKEIHLSGYEVFHDPLHRTKQANIIKYCNRLNVPIIVESTFEISDGIEAISKEYNYILKNLDQS